MSNPPRLFLTRLVPLFTARGGYRAAMSSPAFLFTSTDRVLYRGALGRPRPRVFGAAVCYGALEGALRLSLSDGSQWDAPAVRLPPGVAHQICVERGPVLCYLIEPEFVDWGGPCPSGPFQPEHLPERAWRQALADLCEADLRGWRDAGREPDAELDRLVLGRPLPRRTLDARVAGVVERVRADPAIAWLAADAGAFCGLSASRFMHVFKDEVGGGWRAFRAWKRARGLLDCVHSGESLTQLALALGYPDASHFSHAIRQVTGLRPSDIITGSRRLGVWQQTRDLP